MCEKVCFYETCIGKLPDEEGAVLSKFYFEEMKSEEIADSMRNSIKTIEAILYCAQVKLQTAFMYYFQADSDTDEDQYLEGLLRLVRKDVRIAVREFVEVMRPVCENMDT